MQDVNLNQFILGEEKLLTNWVKLVMPSVLFDKL